MSPEQLEDEKQASEQLDAAVEAVQRGERVGLRHLPVLARLLLQRARREGWQPEEIHARQKQLLRCVVLASEVMQL